MFFWLYSSHNQACQSGGWNAVFLSLFPSFPLLSYFLIAPISFFSQELEAPLCACGLFTRNTDSPSEVWLAGTRRGEKYEWICPTPTPPPLIPKVSHHLSSSLNAPQPPPVTLFHWCVCMCVRESVFVQSQRGSQHWPEAHFCGRASVYPDGLQASRGPAPPSSSIPSP